MGDQNKHPHVDWRCADLRGVGMAGVSLRHADLRAANLSGCNFTGADLSHADFRGAKLQQANLGGAYLEGAMLPQPGATPSPSPSEIAKHRGPDAAPKQNGQDRVPANGRERGHGR